MRDLACCGNGGAFSSTPSDLVRVAWATKSSHVDGVLAGGHVMSLVTAHERGIAVAVTSNMAHAHTAALARHLTETFAATEP